MTVYIMDMIPTTASKMVIVLMMDFIMAIIMTNSNPRTVTRVFQMNIQIGSQYTAVLIRLPFMTAQKQVMPAQR